MNSKHDPRDERGMGLHVACYEGRLDVVTELLANGADPNEQADPTAQEWISCAGTHPRPLNCVAIAWTMTENHVEIARLLIKHGAVVDDSVLRDHTIEMEGGTADFALRSVLETALNK
jgi:ankyrin repeat protein